MGTKNGNEYIENRRWGWRFARTPHNSTVKGVMVDEIKGEHINKLRMPKDWVTQETMETKGTVSRKENGSVQC